MSSNEIDHKPHHVQYVDEQEMRVVVGPRGSDNWNFRKEKSKSKLSRWKATLTRHINVAENLLKSHGSRRKLRELAAKIEKALKELERASEEYESFLELEGLQEHLTLNRPSLSWHWRTPQCIVDQRALGWAAHDSGRSELAVDTSVREINTAVRVTTLFRGSSRVASVHITV